MNPNLHTQGLTALLRPTRVTSGLFPPVGDHEACRVGDASVLAYGSSPTSILLTVGAVTLVLGAVAGAKLDGSPVWGPTLALATIAGFGMGTTQFLLPPEQNSAKMGLALATYALAGAGTGIAVTGLLKNGARA